MIHLENVSKAFGERRLFSNLSITFEAGKVYALIGSSGSGKTTLMNMIGKLESYDGTIFYRNRDLASYQSTDFFRHELGYLFQNFGLIEDQTIEENLRAPLKTRSIPSYKKRRDSCPPISSKSPCISYFSIPIIGRILIFGRTKPMYSNSVV
ncbi:ATP-binding cassette domain-containing protein [Streptococcus danieliae]|uniref:ATP-binding cassette domain-containing protein n=1 Tax=Streptococcus danieliae TaxID=747656 RepID=A0A7X3GA32_9STRE|nr:ATP-binding cassette domain-containing protein [Streptococcus danieliae]MVX59795.1 ATP-binding cassette domain-containing protein [Streptococcus danieliae]